jgi:hypothetical protein
MRPDKENGGNVMRTECDYHPERSREVHDADLGQKIVS